MVTYNIYLLLNCQLRCNFFLCSAHNLCCSLFLSYSTTQTQKSYATLRIENINIPLHINQRKAIFVTFEYWLSLLGTSNKVIPPKGWGSIQNGKRGKKQAEQEYHVVEYGECQNSGGVFVLRDISWFTMDYICITSRNSFKSQVQYVSKGQRRPKNKLQRWKRTYGGKYGQRSG